MTIGCFSLYVIASIIAATTMITAMSWTTKSIGSLPIAKYCGKTVFPALVVVAEWFTAIVMFNIHKKTKLGRRGGRMTKLIIQYYIQHFCCVLRSTSGASSTSRLVQLHF